MYSHSPTSLVDPTKKVRDNVDLGVVIRQAAMICKLSQPVAEAGSTVVQLSWR